MPPSVSLDCGNLENDRKSNAKQRMKRITNILLTLLLGYALLMLVIDGSFSILSLSPQSNISILIEERVVPYTIGIVCIINCIIRIWKTRK